MKIRNKITGQTFEVMAGTLYPSFFEEVADEEIKVGEPKVEAETKEAKDTLTDGETEEATEEQAETETEEGKAAEEETEKATKTTTKKGKKEVKDGEVKQD